LLLLVISDVRLMFGQQYGLIRLPLQRDLRIECLHTFFREHHSFFRIVTGMSMEVGVIRWLGL
jgi:hypothetical protein